MKEVHVGDIVIYTNPKGEDHNALVTAVWGAKCINLVYVSNNTSEGDGYGRQIKSESSSSYADVSRVHGNYWRFVEDEKVPYTPPVEK